MAIRARFPFFGGRDGGQATVEFALLLPLLLLILVGLLDFGRAVNYYNTLTELSAEGARSAAVNATPNGVSPAPNDKSIQNQIKCTAVSKELTSNASFHVSIWSGTAGSLSPNPIPAGKPVLVQTTYNFKFIPFLKFATITLVGSAAMRAEQNSTYALGQDSAASCP